MATKITAGEVERAGDRMMIRHVALAIVPLCLGLFALTHGIVRYRLDAAGMGAIALELLGGLVAAGLGAVPVLRAVRVQRVVGRARRDPELAWQQTGQWIGAAGEPALGFAITARLARPA